MIVGLVVAAALGGIVLVALSMGGRDSQATYEACRREVRPVLSAVQGLGSHLDVGVNQGDYASEVGDVNATYDRLTAKHLGVPCEAVVRALGEAVSYYADASSEWNECIFSEEEECGGGSVQELWLKADVAIAKGRRLLSSLAGGADGVAAVISDEAQSSADALAKERLRSSVVAIETYSIDHGSSYSGATVAALRHIEPTIPDNVEVESTSGTYTISVPSEGGNWFAISNEEGPLSFTCGQRGKGACPASGEWE